MKQKICIITSGFLPVPDVKGGAIERLMTILIDENEKKELLDITMVGLYDETACDSQRKYSKTKFVNIQPTESKNPIVLKIKDKLRWYVRKFTGYDIHYKKSYVGNVDQFLKKNGKQYDLFLSEGYDYEALITAAKLFGKEKVCWHLHMNPPFNKRIDSIYGKCVAVSNYILAKYRSLSKNSIENTAVIFNGIDTANFFRTISMDEKIKIRKNMGLNEDDFVIVFCGRLVKNKGVKELIEAVLNTKNERIKLIIMGSSNFGDGDKGSYPFEVKQLVQENKDRIKFTGYISNDNVYKYHKISDIGVIPSIYQDPCPLSMFEMIASGLPTIATAAGGMTEIGNTETTLFVSIDNVVQELSNAILYLYKDDVRRKSMEIAAKKRALEFSKERFYSNFYDTIFKIIK